MSKLISDLFGAVEMLILTIIEDMLADLGCENCSDGRKKAILSASPLRETPFATHEQS